MYNRISIIGSSGSGKTTLSNILSKELNLPVLHIDGLNYSPNWVVNDPVERDRQIIAKAAEEKWIIDGTYSKTLKERFERADLIIWLNYSTLGHLRGVIKRFLKSPNQEKPEIPGCEEQLNLSFLKFVLLQNKKKRPIIMENLKDIPQDKILIFKKQKDLNKWLKDFTNNENILDGIK